MINQEFISELLSSLKSIGYGTDNIECVLQEGSSLYLKDYGDIDFKVIVKNRNPNADTNRQFDIQGKIVE